MADQTNPTTEDLLKALTQTLASKPLPQNRLREIAEAISEARSTVVGYDVFPLGIVVDHRWGDTLQKIDLSKFTDERLGKIHRIEIFPEGIIAPDQARLRISHTL